MEKKLLMEAGKNLGSKKLTEAFSLDPFSWDADTIAEAREWALGSALGTICTQMTGRPWRGWKFSYQWVSGHWLARNGKRAVRCYGPGLEVARKTGQLPGHVSRRIRDEELTRMVADE